MFDVMFQTFCCVSVGLFTVGLLIFWFYILLHSQTCRVYKTWQVYSAYSKKPFLDFTFTALLIDSILER